MWVAKHTGLQHTVSISEFQATTCKKFVTKVQEYIQTYDDIAQLYSIHLRTVVLMSRGGYDFK